MPDLENLTGRDYLSYSSLSSYLDCSERFRLERVLNAPQTGGWWFVGGHAVHTATEELDKGLSNDPVGSFLKAWNDEVRTLTERGVDLSTIRAGGRKTNLWPDKENDQWWRANGQHMVIGWQQWVAARKAEGWSFYAMPDGAPAVEVPFHLTLGGVLVKGYIDRVMVNPDGEVVIIDLKTGNTTPSSSLQLGVYALGFHAITGVMPSVGAYYMARKSELSAMSSLLHYDATMVGDWFAKTKVAIEAEVFVPHVTNLCGTCSVAPYCRAVGGSDAQLLRSPKSLPTL